MACELYLNNLKRIANSFIVGGDARLGGGVKGLPFPGDFFQGAKHDDRQASVEAFKEMAAGHQPSNKADNSSAVPSLPLGPMAIPPWAVQGPGVAGRTHTLRGNATSHPGLWWLGVGSTLGFLP